MLTGSISRHFTTFLAIDQQFSNAFFTVTVTSTYVTASNVSINYNYTVAVTM